MGPDRPMPNVSNRVRNDVVVVAAKISRDKEIKQYSASP